MAQAMFYREFAMEAKMDDQEVLRRLSSDTAALSVDPMDRLLAAGRSIPADGAAIEDERLLYFIRYRMNASQKELASIAGMSQSQISALENGDDALVSTWRRVYRALGFDGVLLLPVSSREWNAIKEEFDGPRQNENLGRFRARGRRRPRPVRPRR